MRNIHMSRPGAVLSLLTLALAAGLAVAQDEGITEPPITSLDREHWSFAPLVRPPVPLIEAVPLEVADEQVRLQSWPQNAIDHFILARLLRAGLTPSEQADRGTLIRRLSFDLTGLPPTVEEITAFMNDVAPDAYERLVERLLLAPAYGERWAQHWLDLARFAETDGFEHDKLRPDAWRFRDWVIGALNADMPFDEFTLLQLAGDEVSAETRIAAGFLTCGPDMPDINRQDERRADFLNDMTSTVGSVFLGVQIGCAQCHDHKFDPISQLDFYRLRAFFDRAFEFKRDALAAPPSGNRYEYPSKLLIRGDFRRPGPDVEPAFLRVANVAGETPHVGDGDSNLRSELARWLTQTEHPLTTRTLANRLWQYHFGTELTQTPSDVGLMGDSPTHDALLNWLATEIPRRGWSLKAIHRLIVTSATYRQQSRLPGNATSAQQARWQQTLSRDPSNQLHSRGMRRRLEGEAIRDTMLMVAGRLSQRRGGQGVRPPLPAELVQTLLKNQWTVSDDQADWDRRSVYLFVRRNLRYPLFEAFDRPDTNSSCPRRNRSTIAPQALVLLNSELSFELAQAFAGSIRSETSLDVARQIERVYERALGRRPDAGELDAALRFISEDRQNSGDRLVELCLAVFNLNEFIYVD